MERMIVEFISQLRNSGIRVSTSETLDAIQALALGGVKRRRLTRRLLRMTLVKKVQDIAAFDEAFDRFFGGAAGESDSDTRAILDLALIDLAGEAGCLDECESHGPNRDALLKIQSDVPENADALEGLEESEPDDAGSDEMVVKLKGYRGKAQAPQPSNRYPQNQVPLQLNQQQSVDGGASFSEMEQLEMQDVVSRMMLRLSKDARRQRGDRRGKLNVIKTLQKNYRHDVIPFQVVLRRRRREKPRLVVLCDISYSVSHAARFMMLLLHTLQHQHLDVRSFIFNREVEEITQLLIDLPVNDLMRTIDTGDIIDLDENSSFGEVFLSFRKKYLDSLRGRPAVIILGDARNNYSEPNEWVLEEIREKARYMLWLTPEERELWDRGDCLLETYGAYCDQVEVVRTVEELSQVVEDLLREVSAGQQRRFERRRLRGGGQKEEYDPKEYYTHGRMGK